MGRTTYECQVTMFPSKKKGILTDFRQGGRGEFPQGRVYFYPPPPPPAGHLYSSHPSTISAPFSPTPTNAHTAYAICINLL